MLAYFERAWAGEVVRYHQDLEMTTVKYDTAHRETSHLYSTLFPIPTGGSQRPNIVVVQEDITKRKRAAEELQRLHEQVLQHATELEKRVAERTAELDKMVNLMAGCEVRMAELKEIIRQLRTTGRGRADTCGGCSVKDPRGFQCVKHFTSAWYCRSYY